MELAIQAPPANADAETALEEIRRRNLYVLNPQRAARFIDQHLPAKGARISTETLRIATEDNLLDLLAALAFDSGPAGASRRPIRWRVLPARADFGLEPERIPRDPEGDRLVERFVLERTS